MAAAVSVPVVDGAPGNTITVPGTGLSPGAGASVTLSNQGVTAQPGLTPTTITLPGAVFSTTSVSIPIPDGVMDGTLTITAGDATSATVPLRACSQYVQASEYIGEGVNVSGLAQGELDVILRRASSAVDTFIGDGVRLLERLDHIKYRPQPNGAPKIYPFRTRGRRVPLLSVQQLTFVSASDLVTVFNPGDFYINPDLNYIEILAYAVGNYMLLAQLQTIGYSANVIELTYTSGYSVATYPAPIRDATIMMATALLNRRQRQTMGAGPFSKLFNDVTIDQAAVTLPLDAKRMLIPYVAASLA